MSWYPLCSTTARAWFSGNATTVALSRISRTSFSVRAVPFAFSRFSSTLTRDGMNIKTNLPSDMVPFATVNLRGGFGPANYTTCFSRVLGFITIAVIGNRLTTKGTHSTPLSQAQGRSGQSAKHEVRDGTRENIESSWEQSRKSRVNRFEGQHTTSAFRPKVNGWD